MPIDMSIQTLKVDASNIDEKIQKLLDESHGLDIWVVPLQKQLDRITTEWADPKSDGTSKLFYLQHEKLSL